MRFSLFSVNDHYSRLERTVPQLYQQVIHSCELAERLGFDTFFCAEHHFHEYGVVPDPAVMLSALAQRTKRIRLGTAISILTFHDPRRIAETYSMVDMMSGGRPLFGGRSGLLAAEVVRQGQEGKGEGDPHDDDHVFTLPTYVAKTDDEARLQAKAAYDLYVDTRLYAKKHVYEDIIANGICLFGSVEPVAKKMCQLHEMGIRHVATMHNFGALDPALVERSMTLFAREVMPKVESRIGATV